MSRHLKLYKNVDNRGCLDGWTMSYLYYLDKWTVVAGLSMHGYKHIFISISTLKLNIMGPQNQIIGIIIISINKDLVHATGSLVK